MLSEVLKNPPFRSANTLLNKLYCYLFVVPAPFACTAVNHLFVLESKTGSLASYNYPLPYDDKIECIWRFQVDMDYKIKLSFDFFNLSHSTDCSEDYVEVRDDASGTGELLGKFCGSNKPVPITSDSRDMYVAFKSSGKTKYPGFKASYETKSKYFRPKYSGTPI